MSRKTFRKAVVILFWLAAWFCLALAVDNDILLASPQTVLTTFLKLIVTVPFWRTILGSLLRISAGFLLGFLAAVLLAALSFKFRIVEDLLDPPVGLMKTIPVASFVVLLLIWWGTSMLAVAICLLVVFPNIYINTLEGLRSADRKLLEMAKVFHMPAMNRFFYIYRPALRPFLESGLKLALGMSWKSGVAAEVIGTPVHSIGGELYLAKVYLDTPGVLAWTAVIILLSLCLEKLVLWLMKHFFAWSPVWKMREAVYKTHETEDGINDGAKSDCRQNKHGQIVLFDVSKSFNEKKILDDISTTYEAGKTYYLTSPSGSGKTTLFRILCGLETADAGEVSGPERYSMVFQEDRLCEEYSALLNVTMVTGKERAATEALEMLLDAEDLRKPCVQLSGGMKRRVALVRAMESESEAVLLDEPFTGMDADTMEKAQEYIRERQQGRILVIATHIASNLNV